MRPKFISIATYRDGLVALAEDGSIWVGTGDLLTLEFTWSCVQR